MSATGPSSTASGLSGGYKFQLYIKNKIRGLDAQPIGELNGQVVVGGIQTATVFTITDLTTMVDPDNNKVYFVPTSGSRLTEQGSDPTLDYAAEPPSNSVSDGFVLDGITLASNSSRGYYNFYICSTQPQAQPIYVAGSGTVPSGCYSFTLVTTPPPLEGESSTSGGVAPTNPAATSGAAGSGSPGDATAVPTVTGGAALSGSGGSLTGGKGSPTSGEGSPTGNEGSPTGGAASSGNPLTGVSGTPFTAASGSPDTGTGGISGIGASAPAATSSSAAIVVQSVPGFANRGLYDDFSSSPLLADNTLTDDTVSVESCAAHCLGFSYFAVGYGVSHVALGKGYLC